jgi:hypothetical protein
MVHENNVDIEIVVVEVNDSRIKSSNHFVENDNNVNVGNDYKVNVENDYKVNVEKTSKQNESVESISILKESKRRVSFDNRNGHVLMPESFWTFEDRWNSNCYKLFFFLCKHGKEESEKEEEKS